MASFKVNPDSRALTPVGDIATGKRAGLAVDYGVAGTDPSIWILNGAERSTRPDP